jgi:hypothetical protein
MEKAVDLLPGTLDMLILKAVSLRNYMDTPYCSASGKSQARFSIFHRDRCIRRFTVWSIRL